MPNATLYRCAAALLAMLPAAAHALDERREDVQQFIGQDIIRPAARASSTPRSLSRKRGTRP